MTMNDVKENVRNMSDKELAYAASVGYSLRHKPGFDRLDKELLSMIEFEVMCRLSDNATYDEFDKL